MKYLKTASIISITLSAVSSLNNQEWKSIPPIWYQHHNNIQKTPLLNGKYIAQNPYKRTARSIVGLRFAREPYKTYIV